MVMYSELPKEIERIIEHRDEFFIIHKLECTCAMGKPTCFNCEMYYSSSEWREKIMHEYYFK